MLLLASERHPLPSCPFRLTNQSEEQIRGPGPHIPVMVSAVYSAQTMIINNPSKDHNGSG